ncbi:MAG: S-layer protein, partial [Methanomicrobiales archaeon]|nr:S-layer protein [Methanomicrobiales archaeon]
VTDPVTFGVPIGGKIEFSVVSPPEQIAPGEKTVIEVEYKNTGSAEVFRAQARLSAVDPFTSSDDTAFLGDLKPGQSAIARYDLSADAAATVKIYGLDSEIRYRDALDNPQISKTMKVEIEMTERPGLLSSLSSPLVLIVILVAIAGAAYYIVKVRRKDR